MNSNNIEYAANLTHSTLYEVYNLGDSKNNSSAQEEKEFLVSGGDSSLDSKVIAYSDELGIWIFDSVKSHEGMAENVDVLAYSIKNEFNCESYYERITAVSNVKEINTVNSDIRLTAFTPSDGSVLDKKKMYSISVVGEGGSISIDYSTDSKNCLVVDKESIVNFHYSYFAIGTKVKSKNLIPRPWLSAICLPLILLSPVLANIGLTVMVSASIFMLLYCLWYPFSFLQSQ